MSTIERAAILVAILLSTRPLVGEAAAACSPSALEAVRAELRAALPPVCGSRTLRHAFRRARTRAAFITGRAAIRCANGQPASVVRAHSALMKVVAKLANPAITVVLTPGCTDKFQSEIDRLLADLIAAATGIETTTTTTSLAVPGAPTTLAPCTSVQLDVDKGDCTSVTSDPRGLVRCGADCDEQIFTVPAVGTIRLLGTPGPGDVGVTFDTDCDDDGTLDLTQATPPDCSLECDCSSGQ